MAERDTQPAVAENRNPRDEAKRVQDERSTDGNGSDGHGVLNDQDAKGPEVHSPAGSKSEKVSTGEKETEKKKPSKVKELWGKLGLDMGTVMMMFK